MNQTIIKHYEKDFNKHIAVYSRTYCSYTCKPTAILDIHKNNGIPIHIELVLGIPLFL